MKKIILVSLLLACVLLCSACSNAPKADPNVRRIAVINTNTENTLFEYVGVFTATRTNNRLEIITETGEQHFVYMNASTMFIIEDVAGI